MPGITDVVKNLIIINVIVFFGTMFLPPEIKDWLVVYFPLSEHFRPVQLVTHMFNHADPMHLFSNMFFGLFMFGSLIEMHFGAKKFLFYYFFCGFGALLIHMGVDYFQYLQIINTVDGTTALEVIEKGRDIMYQGKQYSNDNLASLNRILNIPLLGASGAVYGVILANGVLYPQREISLLFLPFRFKMAYLVLAILTLDFLGAFTGFQLFGRGNIAHFAHLGGALSGFLLIQYWRKFGSR